MSGLAGPVRGILVTGADGQLGRSLKALSRQPGCPVQYRFAGREALDITRPDAIEHWLDQAPVDCVINAAAYTAVDRAAAEFDQAMAINAQAPGLLARACANRGIQLLHVSTDYVFDGRLGRPYRETDAAAPLNTYGRSKWLGEQAVVRADPDAMILRTSWVFSAWEPNFVHTMLRLAQRGGLRVVDDQHGGPTWAGHLALALQRMAVQAPELPGGIYHFTGRPWTSWHGFAQEICRQAQERGLLPDTVSLQAMASTDWPAAEPRPADSRLDSTRLESLLGPLAHDWRLGLAAVLDDLQ